MTRCPQGVILLRKSGRLAMWKIPCDRWGCIECRAAKLDTLVARVMWAANGAPLFAGELGPADAKAAARQLQRRKAGRVMVGRPRGGALVVTDQPLAARDWSWSLVELDPAKLYGLILAKVVKRVDWSDDWRPPKENGEAGGPADTDAAADPMVARLLCAPGRLPEVRAALINSDMVLPDPRGGLVLDAGVSPERAAARIETILWGRRRPSEHFHTQPA